MDRVPVERLPQEDGILGDTQALLPYFPYKSLLCTDFTICGQPKAMHFSELYKLLLKIKQTGCGWVRTWGLQVASDMDTTAAHAISR